MTEWATRQVAREVEAESKTDKKRKKRANAKANRDKKRKGMFEEDAVDPDAKKEPDPDDEFGEYVKEDEAAPAAVSNDGSFLAKMLEKKK